MKYVCVMPWVDRAWADDCLKSTMLEVEPIDNSYTNRGVARSWNLGIDKMFRDEADWLIVLSTAVRFGPSGGSDFLELLEQRPEFHVIQPLATYGWHMVAFSRKAIEAAGRFDENFFPGYYEDIDYSIRLHHAGIDPEMRGGFACDVQDAGMAHSLFHGVAINNKALLAYFVRKWGTKPTDSWEAYYRLPFNKKHPINFWPPAATGGRHNEPCKEML